MPDQHQQLQTLIQHVENIIQRDHELREKYAIANKFRFIREQLQTLANTLKNHLTKHPTEIETITTASAETEALIHIHLFNAQGILLRSWQNMLTPKLLREFGFNRPIYAEKAAIDAFLRSKSNKIQHAYLTIAVKPEDILGASDDSLKDALGNPLIKIKEGSLTFKNIRVFTHNGQEYMVGIEGELVKR